MKIFYDVVLLPAIVFWTLSPGLGPLLLLRMASSYTQPLLSGTKQHMAFWLGE